MKILGSYIFENHLSLGINEVPVNGTVIVIDFYGETKITTKLSNSGLSETSTIEDFLLLESQWKYLGKPSELEAIEEANISGWRLYKRNPLDYGNIGKDAIDFSITDGGFSENGATGERSFSVGFNSHAVGMYSFAEGLTTVLDVALITGPQGGGIDGGVPEGSYNIYGVPEGSYNIYGVPEGSYNIYGVPETPNQSPNNSETFEIEFI